MPGESTGAAGAELDSLLAALTGDDPAAGEMAVAKLALLAVEESAAALKRLAHLAASADPDRRWWAVRSLAALNHVDPIPLLATALRDPDSSVRQCTALGLRTRPDVRAIPALIASLADGDGLVARLAVDALAAIGSETVPALIEVLTEDSQPIQAESNTASAAARIGALRALAAIGDTRSIPALFAALDGSTLEEYWAVQGLERMGVGMSFFNPQ